MASHLDSSPSATRRTYSLIEVAQILCGDDSEAAQRWIRERLLGHAHPTLPGFRVQRRWRMTQEDLDAAIELLRPKRNEVVVPSMTSMTARSQRRLAV